MHLIFVSQRYPFSPRSQDSAHYYTGAHDCGLIKDRFRGIALRAAGYGLSHMLLEAHSDHSLYFVSVSHAAAIIPHKEKNFYNIL